MDPASHSSVIPLIVSGSLVTVSAAVALCWACRRGQFRNLHSHANTVFTEEEPRGVVTDSFPDRTQ